MAFTHRLALNERERTSWMESFNPVHSLMLRMKPSGTAGTQSGGGLLAPAPRIHPLNEITVTVVGCGCIGIDIAGELLRRGCRSVRCYDSFPEVRETILILMQEQLEMHVEDGALLERDIHDLLARLVVADSLEEAIDDTSLIVEAVPEQPEIKANAFRDIVNACEDRSVDPNSVVLCTNTMTVPLSVITSDLPRVYADRVLGMRFLFPCWFVDEVELTMNPDWCAYACEQATCASSAGEASSSASTSHGSSAASTPPEGRSTPESETSLLAAHPSSRHAEAAASRTLYSSQPAMRRAEQLLRRMKFTPVRSTHLISAERPRVRRISAAMANLYSSRQRRQTSHDSATAPGAAR